MNEWDERQFIGSDVPVIRDTRVGEMIYTNIPMFSDFQFGYAGSLRYFVELKEYVYKCLFPT